LGELEKINKESSNCWGTDKFTLSRPHNVDLGSEILNEHSFPRHVLVFSEVKMLIEGPG
jgi:hypothetical protein